MPQTTDTPSFEAMKAFLVERYKYDRLYGRGEEYGDCVVNSRIEEIQKKGYDGISHFEAKSGEAIWFRFIDGELREGPAPKWR